MNSYAPWVGINQHGEHRSLPLVARMGKEHASSPLVVHTMGGSSTMAGCRADDRPPRATAEFPNAVFRIGCAGSPRHCGCVPSYRHRLEASSSCAVQYPFPPSYPRRRVDAVRLVTKRQQHQGLSALVLACVCWCCWLVMVCRQAPGKPRLQLMPRSKRHDE